jgi:hypothetical protein
MSEKPIILDAIPFETNLQTLIKTLRLKPDSAYARQVEQMANDAQAIARPKVFFKLAFVDIAGR